MLALSAMPNEVMAQRGERDLPRTIKEAGERLRNRSVSVTELIKTYINGAKQLGPKLNPFITLTEEERKYLEEPYQPRSIAGHQ